MTGQTDPVSSRLVVGLAGSWPTAEEWSWLVRWRPAGVILFSRNVQNFPQLQQLCAELKGQVPGLLVMADHEGGPVSQLAPAVGRPPVAYALGRLEDPDLTRRVHLETGRRLKSAGLDLVLAPCADVLSEARNPVIGARSFGEDSQRVAVQVAAAVQGLRAGGLACCLKHWPGHGGSRTDSHLEITGVEFSPDQKAPFLAGLAAGAESVMPGHLLLPGHEDPVTLSAEFLERTRQDLSSASASFRLICDDVTMGALREPMARRGVPLPACDPGQGMIDPDHLPRAWFEELLRAGHDWLLIRALPRGAFPCPLVPGPWPERAPESEPAAEFSDADYQEARQRQSIVFSDPEASLVFLDLARHDRWQVATGQGAAVGATLDQLLARHFLHVQRRESLDSPLEEPAEVGWLLVASHRPLPRDWTASPWAVSCRKSMASEGRCLVMGHPSLAGDLGDFLGPGWVLQAVYDVVGWEI